MLKFSNDECETGARHPAFVSSIRHSKIHSNFVIRISNPFTPEPDTTMATITAILVNELRAKTGQGMMECKKMLTETGGDLQAAIDAFRKKGVKTSIAERAATEGRVFAATSSR